MSIHENLNASVVYNPQLSYYASKRFDCSTYYYLAYKAVPNCIELSNDIYAYNHIIEFLKKDYNFDESNAITYHNLDKNSKSKLAVNERICDLKNGIVVHLCEGSSIKELYIMEKGSISDFHSEKEFNNVIKIVCIYYVHDKYQECLSIVNRINDYYYSTGSKGIKIICKNCNDFYTSSASVRDPKIEDMSLNYGKNFKSVHEKIYDWIYDESKEGIILLHGPPGTGKTSYLRYLINKCENKDFIYMPPNISEKISDPAFLPFLLENKSSVLIIEDAENIIKDREDPTVKTEAVANLLNISDGLLSDGLHQKIIATFNCDLSKIDPALLRKGRLMTQYKFEKLDIADAQSLADHLNIKTKVTEPMTLAEIFNI